MLTAALDSARARILRITLRPTALRRLYANTPARLLAGFLFFALVYLPLALRRPDLLLVFGPLVFGYPHLLASYRFLPGRKPFFFFALLTAASMGANEALGRLGWIPELPFGAWELAVAAIVATLSSHRVRPAILCAATGYLLWKLSWREPLIFAGSVLLAHNWVAILVWARKARGAGRLAALVSAAIFGAVHLVVFLGYADFLMPLSNLEVLGAAVPNTGAALAPWSSDLTIWYRAVVLYTFGLSLHYYVWLKAVPECEGRVPLSWRRTFELLKREFGRPAFYLAGVVAGAGILIWCARLELGARIYFRIATLHGWLELMFLISSWRPGLINNTYLQIKHLAAARTT